MKKQKNKHNQRPVRLGIISDFYTTGIFCGKTNLIEYAEKLIKRVKDKKSDTARLFYLGVSRAHLYTFDDIAMEMYEMHKFSGDDFYDKIRTKAGSGVVKQIKAAIERAKKNPWDSLVQVNSEYNKGDLCKGVFVEGTGQRAKGN